MFRTAGIGVHHGVGDAIENAAGKSADEGAVEFITKRERDLARVGGELGQVPFALEAAERPAFHVNRHPVRRRFGFRVVRSKRSP
jgi:hypothetical protein